MKLLVLFTFLIALVKSQTTISPNVRTVRSRCSDFQEDQLESNLESCLKSAQSKSRGQLESDPLGAICTLNNGAFSCINTNLQSCYSSEHAYNKAIDFVIEKGLVPIYENFNDRDAVTVIQNCDILRSVESYYMNNVFGSNKCGFERANKALEQYKACNRRVSMNTDKRLTSANSRNDVIKVFCTMRSEFNSCRFSFTQCLSSSKANQIIRNDNQFYKEFEDDLQGFTFQLC